MLVLGTSNPHKIAEFKRLLGDVPLLSLSDVGCELDFDETGKTYAENAALKASAYARATGHWVLSDDTGLEVDALGGGPGIYSARFAGDDASAAENVAKLLDQLQGVARREASFHCALALASPDGIVRLEAHGVLPGRILESPAGEGGFTYDYLFFEPKSGCTLAEIPSFAADRLSHRAVAVNAMKQQLLELIADWKGSASGQLQDR